MLETIRYCTLDLSLDVESRLNDLGRWERDWQAEDEALAAEQRHCNLDTRSGINRFARIATIRTRLHLNKVREPLTLPGKEELQKMDIKELGQCLRSQYRKLETTDRLHWLNNLHFIMTPDLHKANRKIENLLGEATARQRRGLLLFAESRMGKTSYLDFLWCQFRPIISENHNIVPIMKAEAPASNLSTITLPQRFVMEFGNVSTRRDTEERLNRKLSGYTQICETRLGMIDEAENIHTHRMQRKLIELWNYFPNVVLICASCEIQQFVSGSDQIRNRWDVSHELKTFSKEDLRDFLTFLDFIIPLPRSSLLASDRMVSEIYSKTKGNLWRVINLIHRASEVAIHASSPRLTKDILNDAWDLYIHAEPNRWMQDKKR